jgi:hypothetical protein
MSSRFPTSLVRRFNHRAGYPVPYTRDQWLEALKLAALNNWRLYGPSTVSVSNVAGMLTTAESPLEFSSFVVHFAFRTIEHIYPGISLLYADDVLIDSLESDLLYVLLVTIHPDPEGQTVRAILASHPPGLARHDQFVVITSVELGFENTVSSVVFSFRPDLQPDLPFGMYWLRRFSPSGWPLPVDPGVLPARSS